MRSLSTCNFFFWICAHSAVICRQRDPAVRADPLRHDRNRNQGDDEGEGVRRAPDPRVAAATEEETSRGGF